MTEIPSKYEPASAEGRWYSYWMEKGFFRSVPDAREPYTIIIPPPNVTGVLHMGHMLNNTTQDVLIRRARMLGFKSIFNAQLYTGTTQGFTRARVNGFHPKVRQLIGHVVVGHTDGHHFVRANQIWVSDVTCLKINQSGLKHRPEYWNSQLFDLT